MEIIFSSKTSNYSITFPVNYIIGMTGSSEKHYSDILNSSINNQDISIIRNKMIYLGNLYYAMKSEIRKKRIVLKNPDKKIIDALKIVGLSVEKLNQDISTFSTSEKKLALLALGLLKNTKVIMIEEPFRGLDYQQEKVLFRLLKKLQDKYKKSIILVSTNSEYLYQYTEYLFVMKNNKVIKEGRSYDIYKDIRFLRDNKIHVPKINEITYLAQKNKNIKIYYHRDVRDIIKDIYRHV